MKLPEAFGAFKVADYDWSDVRAIFSPPSDGFLLVFPALPLIGASSMILI